MTTVHGMHHVTCIAGEVQENLNFYVGVMGLHLVKRSVNQDVPGTYHLFYADGVGTPGTDLTFFPWPDMGPGRMGVGLTVEIPLAVPAGSLSYWQHRFTEHAVAFSPLERRFGELTLPFQDRHGLRLALVEIDDQRQFVAWENSPLPLEVQVRGMHAVRLWERELIPTQELLTECLGFTHLETEAGWHRYQVDGGGSGKYIDIREMPGEQRGQWGVGSNHHVAWRVKDEGEQMELRGLIEQMGRHPTPQIDRFWFKSVYFREPGGALFELATDGPGFGRDEDVQHLGERLILPPWLENQRAAIEATLPPLNIAQTQIFSDLPH